MTRTDALEIARESLPADCLQFWLDADPEPDEDDVHVWTGSFESEDGARATFAFPAHYPEAFEIDWSGR